VQYTAKRSNRLNGPDAGKRSDGPMTFWVPGLIRNAWISRHSTAGK